MEMQEIDPEEEDIIKVTRTVYAYNSDHDGYLVVIKASALGRVRQMSYYLMQEHDGSQDMQRLEMEMAKMCLKSLLGK